MTQVQYMTEGVHAATVDECVVTEKGSVRFYDASFVVTGERAKQLQEILRFLGMRPKDYGSYVKLTLSDSMRLIEQLIHEGISSLYGYARMDGEQE